MAEEPLDEVYERHVRPLSRTEQLRLAERIVRETAAEMEAEAARAAGVGADETQLLVAILEDQAPRAEAMCAEIQRRAPHLQTVVFDNAPDMIFWLPDHVAALALVSLDHDLGPNRERDGRSFDPATGRVVATVLANLTPACPVIIHSENVDAALAAVDLVDRLGVSWTHPRDGRLKRLLAPWVRFPHRCMYDARSLLDALRNQGLVAEPCPPLVSRIPDVADVECLERVRDSVIAEGRKPD